MNEFIDFGKTVVMRDNILSVGDGILMNSLYITTQVGDDIEVVYETEEDRKNVFDSVKLQLMV